MNQNHDLIFKEECYKLVGLCMEIHRILGGGLPELTYQDALEHECQLNNIPYRREKRFPVLYKEVVLPHQFRADFVAYDNIIVELKGTSEITNAHIAQTIHYVRLTRGRLGILINFSPSTLQYKRIIV
jgi:GxxExxY protein